jgi:hypothetical protein
MGQMLRYGVAIDQQLARNLFAGGELSKRELDIPTPERAFDVDETFARLYVKVDDDPLFTLVGLAESRTHRVPVMARVFGPLGFFAQAKGTFISQEGRFVDFATAEEVADSDSFWVVDALAGYRFPDQRGVVTLEVRNLWRWPCRPRRGGTDGSRGC